ncbi:ABC transporter permease [Desulfotruncus arcticus]|nr:ABC transporter permease [Desulfotruncus arcticus]
MQEELFSLVDEAISLEKKMKKDKKTLDQLKAKLTNAAYEEMDNKNLKFMQIFGLYGSFNVVHKEKLDIDNFNRLVEVLGEIAKAKITRKEEIKYETESRFKEALIALCNDDYSDEISIEQVLEVLELDDKAIKAVKKKLKGDYLRDKKVLESVGVLGDCEEELHYIRLYKNFELVDRFFGELTDEQIAQIKKAVFIEAGISVGLEYEGRR